MNMIGVIHDQFILERRKRVLAEHISRLMPLGGDVLDIGCGDGKIAKLLMLNRPDVTVNGIDTLRRDQVCIDVEVFDGKEIPCEDDFYDIAMLVDVLHHTDNPRAMLKEACRVSRRGLIIKDHICESQLQELTLRIMDYVGNARFCVNLKYHYWHEAQWFRIFDELKLKNVVWKNDLGLYPFPLSLIFEKAMHFLTLLEFE